MLAPAGSPPAILGVRDPSAPRVATLALALGVADLVLLAGTAWSVRRAGFSAVGLGVAVPVVALAAWLGSLSCRLLAGAPGEQFRLVTEDQSNDSRPR